MAAVNFFDSFLYKWAQSGAAVTLQDDQYKLGWSFIGSTPPSVEQFNAWGQLSDEKQNWLFAQLKAAATAKGITLAAGDLDGLLKIINAATPNASETVRGLIEIAATAEAQAMLDDIHALTPKKLADAFKGAAQLLAASGFQKSPGGLIHQWGVTPIVPFNTSLLVTLPITYPNSIFNALTSIKAGNTNTSGNVDTVTNSQIRVFNDFHAGTGAGTDAPMFWQTIGH